MRLDTESNGKRITVHDDGEIYVNHDFTGIVQWKSDSKRYSNSSGSEIKDLKGMSLEEVLKYKGWLGIKPAFGF